MIGNIDERGHFSIQNRNIAFRSGEKHLEQEQTPPPSDLALHTYITVHGIQPEISLTTTNDKNPFETLIWVSFVSCISYLVSGISYHVL